MGFLPGNLFCCLKFQQTSVLTVFTLRCNHDEPGHRKMTHVDHRNKICSFQNIIIASPDTDVFVLALYHYNQWICIKDTMKACFC